MRSKMKERVGDVGTSNGSRNCALQKAGLSLLTNQVKHIVFLFLTCPFTENIEYGGHILH
jgi:hypothetical protein